MNSSNLSNDYHLQTDGAELERLKKAASIQGFGDVLYDEATEDSELESIISDLGGVRE
jgi:hypothetical protein